MGLERGIDFRPVGGAEHAFGEWQNLGFLGFLRAHRGKPGLHVARHQGLDGVAAPVFAEHRQDDAQHG